MAASEPRLILASTSRYRRELLQRLGLHFECIAPETDESALPGDTPEELACRLAHAKAEAVAERVPGATVIGSDQVAECNGRVLGKPGGRDAAIDQLRACSGREVVFHTAVSVQRYAESRCDAFVDRTVVAFRPLSDAAIARYVDAEPAFDCAGSFKSEGLGLALFDAVRSNDPTALIGLPLIALSRSLRGFGFEIP